MCCVEVRATWRIVGNSPSAAALFGGKMARNLPHGQEVEFVPEQCQGQPFQGVQESIIERALLLEGAFISPHHLSSQLS